MCSLARRDQTGPGVLIRAVSWCSSVFCGVVRWSRNIGKISLTIVSTGRRHGPARITGGPEGGGAARVAVPEPAPPSRSPTRLSWPRSSSTPETRCRSSTRWCAASAWTARRSPRQRRRSGTPGRRTTRPPPRWPPPAWTAWTAWCRPKPGPRGGHKLTAQILIWTEQQLAGDPALKPASLAGPIAEEFGVRVHPALSSERWPAARSTPKAADPSAHQRRQEENPSLSRRPSPGPAAAEPDTVIHARDVDGFIGSLRDRYQPRTVELAASSLRSIRASRLIHPR
jgi:hypothetical protein